MGNCNARKLRILQPVPKQADALFSEDLEDIANGLVSQQESLAFLCSGSPSLVLVQVLRAARAGIARRKRRALKLQEGFQFLLGHAEQHEATNRHQIGWLWLD